MHWLHRLRELRGNEERVFSVTSSAFLASIKELAGDCAISGASQLGTHAFRRGMAQDIVSAGGSLAVLLKAGEWHSKAFLKYLREAQPQDEAVAQVVINLSDSEVES